MSNLYDTVKAIDRKRDAINERARRIRADLEPLAGKVGSGLTAGEQERFENLQKATARLVAEKEALQTEFEDAIKAEMAAGTLYGEAGTPFGTDGYFQPDGTVVPDRFGTGRSSTAGRPLHIWSKAVIDELGGRTVRQRGTHSVVVPTVGGFLNAWPTDPLREFDADKTPNPAPRRLRFVTDLLEVRKVTEDGLSYIRQTVRTNNAAAVARHGQKPASIFELARVEDRTRTVAHLSEPIALQDLEDNRQLDGFIVDELVHGLKVGLDAEVVAGDGTGEHMSGFLTVITAEEAFDTDVATTCRRAVTTLEESEVEPQAWVMAPGDWEAIDLLYGVDGIPIVKGTPVDRAARRLWSLPVLVSNAVTAGTALLGDFSGARLAVRSESRIDWQTAGSVDDGAGGYYDMFDRNETKARAELRAVLEVLSVPKFIKVALTA
jgi:hypothetical protein